MEKVKTTPELAKSILESGKRKIIIQDGQEVKWINLNNQTLFASKKQSGSTFDIENVELLILVPASAKTVY